MKSIKLFISLVTVFLFCAALTACAEEKKEQPEQDSVQVEAEQKEKDQDPDQYELDQNKHRKEPVETPAVDDQDERDRRARERDKGADSEDDRLGPGDEPGDGQDERDREARARDDQAEQERQRREQEEREEQERRERDAREHDDQAELDSEFDTPYRTYYWYTYDENGEIRSDPSETGIENKYGFLLSNNGFNEVEIHFTWKNTFTYSDFRSKTMPESYVKSSWDSTDGYDYTSYRLEYVDMGKVEKILIYNEAEELDVIRFIESDGEGEIIRDRMYYYNGVSEKVYVTDRKCENTYEGGRLQIVDISEDDYYLDNFDMEPAGLDTVLPSDYLIESKKAKKIYEY